MKHMDFMILKFRSPKAIVLEWYKIKKNIKDKDLKKIVVDLAPFLKKPKNGSVLEAIEIIKQKGFWGFVKYSGNKADIYLWVTKETNMFDVMHLLAHEVSHAAGIKSERKANIYGSVSSFSFYLLVNSFPWLLKKKIKKFDEYEIS